MIRERGHYGPLDRDAHPIAGWSADQLMGYAHDRTIGAAAHAVLPAFDLTKRAVQAGDRLRTGTRLMGGRAEAEKPLAVVGQELFHTVADRSRAIAMLSTGFQALANDLAVWQTSNMMAPSATATAQWLSADVTPTLQEFKGFVERENRSWFARAATSWETLETWWERLKQLRSLARAHGIVLQSVEPVPLPKTIWQAGAEGTGSEATALLGILKIAAAAVLTVMGAVGAYTVIRELRPKPLDQEGVRAVVREELSASKKR